MTWGHIFSGRKSREQRERERLLAQADAEAAQLRERAERVARSLTERLERNHWSKSVRAIAHARREN